MSGAIWMLSPIYFDTEAYAALRERVREVLAGSGVDVDRVRFVAVDDSGGADPGAAALSRDGVRVVTPPFNLGHQRALVYALRTLLDEIGDEDLVVTIDGDGEDRPEDLPRLIEPVVGSGPESRSIAVALRSERREALPFKLLYALFRVLFRSLTGTTIRSGNFAAYQGKVAKAILFHPYFDLCYSSTLVALDVPITYVPCPRGERLAGESKMGYERLLMHGFRMLMPFTDRIALRSLVGFALAFGAGLVLAVAALAVSALTGGSIPLWAGASLAAVMIVSLLLLANAMVLFAVFSQSRGISLSELEQIGNGSPRGPPTAPD